MWGLKSVTDIILLMTILIKTDSHPSKIARSLSISTTYSCSTTTFIIRVFVLLAILRKNVDLGQLILRSFHCLLSRARVRIS